MDNAQPIIVKKIKKGGHGHHGGAWKVAFADFVTAMMAFFMLMWLMGSTTPEQRAAISDYFQNPSAVQGPGGASTSMIKMGAIDEQLNKQEKGKTEQPNDVNPPMQVVQEVQKEIEKDKQRLDNLKEEMEKAIDASEAMKPFKDQLLLDITPEGLRIQIIDKEGRPMFDSGSATLKPYTAEILHEMAKLISTVPNRISLTGHTDATPYSSTGGYSNWELSADRANASRRALLAGGLDEAKVAKVVGLASTVLFDQANPRSPVNRRISLIVLNKATEEALQRESAQVGDAQAMAQALQGEASAPGVSEAAAPAPTEQAAAPAPAPVPTPAPASPAPKPLTLIPLPAKPESRVVQPKPGPSKPVHSQTLSSGSVKHSQAPHPLAPLPLGQAATPASSAIAPPPAQIQPIRPIQPFNPIQLPATH